MISQTSKPLDLRRRRPERRRRQSHSARKSQSPPKTKDGWEPTPPAEPDASMKLDLPPDTRTYQPKMEAFSETARISHDTGATKCGYLDFGVAMEIRSDLQQKSLEPGQPSREPISDKDKGLKNEEKRRPVPALRKPPNTGQNEQQQSEREKKN